MGRSYLTDTGFGDPFTGVLGGDSFGSPMGGDDAGFGDPFAFAYGAAEVVPAGWASASALRFAVNQFGEEGGYLVEITSTTPDFLPKYGYRVDIVDGDGVLYPQLEPGCYSAVPGLGTAVRSYGGGRILRFALPPLPQDTYSVKVTHPDGWTMTIVDAIMILAQPSSLEVESVRAGLPVRVYYGRGDPPSLPVPDPEEEVGP